MRLGRITLVRGAERRACRSGDRRSKPAARSGRVSRFRAMPAEAGVPSRGRHEVGAATTRSAEPPAGCAGLKTGVPSRGCDAGEGRGAFRALRARCRPEAGAPIVAAFVFLLAVPVAGETPEEFSGIPWESLEELPDGLAAVRAAGHH